MNVWDVVDTLAKGVTHLTDLGPVYIASTTLNIGRIRFGNLHRKRTIPSVCRDSAIGNVRSRHDCSIHRHRVGQGFIGVVKESASGRKQPPL